MSGRKIPTVATPTPKGAGRVRPEDGARTYRPSHRPRILTLGEGGVSVAVMVGPLRGPDHLAIIQRWHYYHVPVSAIAEKHCAVDVIAFYEPAARFSRPVGLIQAYAPVLRVSRVPRKELPGLAWPGRHEDAALYYRFDLGPMHCLPQPVTNPEGLRLVFRFADLETLAAAHTIRDLGRSGPARRKAAPEA